MKYKEFMKELIAGKAKGVYLIDSKEEFLTDSALDEARNQVSIPDFNLIDIKGSHDVETIKTSYETYPVMEDKKTIIWRDIDLSKNKVKESNDILANLIDDLKEFPDFALFIIVSNNPPFKSGKFYKAVKKYGTIVEIDRLNKSELESLIGKRFLRNGKKIQKSLIRDIVDRFSYLSNDSEIDLYQIVNSVDKIIASSTDKIVSVEDVNNQLDEVLNLNIFNLTDAISSKDKKRASLTFLKMARSDEDLFMVFHMIIRQVRNLIGVKTLYVGGYNDSFMMKSLGIGGFELKKIKGFIRNFSIIELLDAHKRLFEIEVRQKSTDFNMEMELLLFIQNICE